jgi:WW domain
VSARSPGDTPDEDSRSPEDTESKLQPPSGAVGSCNSGSPQSEEDAPPLPNEAPPSKIAEDDGWQALWDQNVQAYYFYNSHTGITTWTNPRVPEGSGAVDTPGVGNYDRIPYSGDNENGNREPQKPRPHGGYDPSIHGDYDPTAPYAQLHEGTASGGGNAESSDPNTLYTAAGAFNRFTGKWQPLDVTPELHNDENKSRRQMSAFFDVDAAANSHDGRSLKAERSGKKLTKKELKAFKEKRREKKEEKRRAWLRD